MHSEQINQKFTFSSSGKQLISSLSSSNSININAKQNSSRKIPKNHSLNEHIEKSSNTSYNFTIPFEALRLDRPLIKKLTQVENAITLEGLQEANSKLADAESIAENHAILEVNLDSKLLENNIEILVFSRYMNSSILESLLKNCIPIFLYVIKDNELSKKVTILFLDLFVCFCLRN